MADKTVIIKLDVQEAGAISSIETLNNSLKKLDSTSDEYASVLKKIQVEETKLASIQKQRASAQKSVTKALGKQSDATGSATAATMELSRVVSDAPYGIRGMANNITQLVSQLGSASIKAGGLGAALKLMGSQLMGPLGIVFLITAAVSALDYFQGGMKKAKDETKGLNEELEKTNKLLREIDTVLDTLNVTGDSVKFEWLDGFNAGLDELDSKGLLRVLERDIKGITNAFNKLDEEDRNIQGIESLVQKKKDLIESLLKEKTIKAELIALDKEYFVYRSLGDSDKKKELSGEIVDKQKELFATQKKILDIEELFSKKTGNSNSKSKGTIKLLDPKDFEGDLFEIEKMLRKFKHKELTLAAETEQQKGAVKALIELDNFKKEYSSYVESEDQKFDKFKENLEKETSAHKANLDKQLKAKKITQEEFNKAASDGQEARDTALAFAEEEFRDKSLVSYENYLKGLVAISDKYDRDIIGVGVTQFDTLAEQQRKAADRVLTGKLNVFQNQAESAKKILSSMTDFVNGEFDREMTIEQNKTNALNTELNNRLNNENLSKEQRKSIQNEIAQNDEKLRVKQEVIERKRFKMNKAANIANALMDTASAAAGVMAQAKGGFFARLAQAIPTIAFGLAQVATIARQKFQSSASKTPINTTGGGGSGSGEGRAEPSFNIVGRSDDNLLINAIQATFDKPLKAYVVSRDVTNQQQLDGIITDQAGT